MNFVAVHHYAYLTCIFHQYSTELVNCSFTQTFFHSSVRLASYRVVAVKGNDHIPFWLFDDYRTSYGRFLAQPRRKFRIVAFMYLPERVVAVTKPSRREISCR